MKRIKIEPRNNWQKKVESLGFSFHSLGDVYWDESTAYSFKMEEISKLETATKEIYSMCVDTVQYIIDNNLFNMLKIPEKHIPFIVDSWDKDEPSLYGRFDFSYDGNGIPKLLEFNADTPTSILEGSVIQWDWLQDIDKDKDQWNSIHEKLIDSWKWMKENGKFNEGPLYFAPMDDTIEDLLTVEYLRDTAEQAGLDTRFIFMNEIGWNNEEFTDLNESPIKNIFKLYPWEWMLIEEFSKHLVEDYHKTKWIEPAWKMILSNKGFLPILSNLYPDSPYLLKTYYEFEFNDFKESLKETGYVKKPILSREGANIKIFEPGVIDDTPSNETSGCYGKEGYIYQELKKLPNFDGNFPVIGSWVIGGEPAGMGIREASNLITSNTSRFIPHYIED
jgi:glutathionylspermidine synthase